MDALLYILCAQGRTPSPVLPAPDTAIGSSADQSGSAPQQAAQTDSTNGTSSGGADGGGVSAVAADRTGSGAVVPASGGSGGSAASGVIYGSGPNSARNAWQRSNSLVSSVAQVCRP